MKKTVQVVMDIEVEIDESKFTSQFMEEFRQHFYPFFTINDHIEHLAQLSARGLISWHSDFIEGYGHASEMGITITHPADAVVEIV